MKTGRTPKFKEEVQTTKIYRKIPKDKKRKIENKIDDIINELCKDDLFVR
jgi:hypothetical protein